MRQREVARSKLRWREITNEEESEMEDGHEWGGNLRKRMGCELGKHKTKMEIEDLVAILGEKENETRSFG